MRRIALQLLAASSLLLGSVLAETRPHYGGTLHVMVHAAPISLEPAQLEKTGPNLARLIYDTLVTLDDRGIPQPSLATSWQSDPGNQRWQLALRRGVTFSDSSPLTAESVAAALRVGNPSWRVSADAENVVVQFDSPDIDLPAELALVRNSIVRHDAGKLTGTGPFTVTQWQAGKRVVITARDDYFGGRPFLDSVEIDLGGSRTSDWTRYQLAEIATRPAGGGRRVESSAPSDLLALVFARASASPDEERLRDALSLSVDRKVLNDVLLQGSGEPARGMLPGWMTGYDFLFSAGTNLPLASQAVAEAKRGPERSLGYDANDPAARLIAERIALNAADIGLKVVPSITANPDIQLVRLNLASLDSHVALASIAAAIGATPPKFAGTSSEELYGAERALLQSRRVIPLVHLKISFAMAGPVNGWTMNRTGGWHLADVWLGTEKP
ncbi:MAG TPA: ABC transporter substrate-binding protein [Terriglobales bacterium]|jgi:peptide/nickel transport system substrate-binding protein|nr:ABC transporter substrate-binding protein [Terriglobales bacterium]